jgi:hypothetical protein
MIRSLKRHDGNDDELNTEDQRSNRVHPGDKIDMSEHTLEVKQVEEIEAE